MDTVTSLAECLSYNLVPYDGKKKKKKKDKHLKHQKGADSFLFELNRIEKGCRKNLFQFTFRPWNRNCEVVDLGWMQFLIFL